MSNHQPFTPPATEISPPADPFRPIPATAATGRLLSTLYLSRAAFSAAWVAFVYSLASSADSATTLGLLAGVFLIAYPMSDAVASLIELRTASTRLPHYANVAAGLGAAAGIAACVLSDLPVSINIFGGWAVVSGVVQTYLAIARQRDGVRGQWPMILSGAGSVVAGLTFIGWFGTPHGALTAVAQYSAGGAVWYVFAAAWLLYRRGRAAVAGGPATVLSRSTRPGNAPGVGPGLRRRQRSCRDARTEPDVYRPSPHRATPRQESPLRQGQAGGAGTD